MNAWGWAIMILPFPLAALGCWLVGKAFDARHRRWKKTEYEIYNGIDREE